VTKIGVVIAWQGRMYAFFFRKTYSCNCPRDLFFFIVPRELDDSMRKQNSMQTKTFMAYRRNLSYRDLRDRDMNP
jgi:hypothetical protein